MIFVNSMSDLFHPGVPDDFIHAVFDSMKAASRHTFQVLTKRPERAASLSCDLEWSPNIWMGTSVENQRFSSRVALLRKTGARVKFLSCEPLLGPLSPDLSGIDWVIAGGESGPGARPMQIDWLRDLRDQCHEAGVAFFFKQWGAFDEAGVRRGKKASGRMLDGVLWNEFPAAASR
jgi:protein gp37